MINAEKFYKFFKNKKLQTTYSDILKNQITNYWKEKYNSFEDFKEKIDETIANINKNSYYPNNNIIISYISKNELNYREVFDIDPVDEIIFYYLVNEVMSSSFNEINRVPNTFGGYYKKGNIFAKLENKDIEKVDLEDPYHWFYHWKEFEKVIISKYRKNKFQYIARFDFSNFYDSIIIEKLIKRLREKANNKVIEQIDLIEFYLKNWKNSISKYQSNIVGLPQSTYGEAYRMLANFYINDYDIQVFKLCEKYKNEYARYSDDQLYFINDYRDSQSFFKSLNRIAKNHYLNFNYKSSLMTFESFIDAEMIFEISSAKQELELDPKFNKRLNLILEKIQINSKSKLFIRIYSILNQINWNADMDLKNLELCLQMISDFNVLKYCNKKSELKNLMLFFGKIFINNEKKVFQKINEIFWYIRYDPILQNLKDNFLYFKQEKAINERILNHCIILIEEIIAKNIEDKKIEMELWD
ncbi:RNA-dependent RNA polymerase family protein [Mesoplasma florum]|uniref:hypothetical protein n=1 Tax=Mesoplasma florum TaxID=2151 RepID=UPI000D08A3EE|nr:hypothetical protein [Mesoplasma florum]AVN61104.1 hypothetical protein CG005_02280 [Mesoplasma florum]